jgi:hypothetical protein
MYIVNPDNEPFHRARISIGTIGAFVEGPRKVAICEVVAIHGLVGAADRWWPAADSQIFGFFRMHIATILSIVGAFGAGSAFAYRKQWLMSLAWFFSLAYTIFDKVFPSVLPENLVISFSFIFLILVLIFCWQTFPRKKVA